MENDIIKIILIDDSEADLLIAEKLILHVFENCEVLKFNSVFDVLRKLESAVDESFLMFLDLFMPEIDGWYFLDLYHKLNRKNLDNIYMLSAVVNDENISRARSHPLLQGFLAKPLNQHALSSIKNHLGLRG